MNTWANRNADINTPEQQTARNTHVSINLVRQPDCAQVDRVVCWCLSKLSFRISETNCKKSGQQTHKLQLWNPFGQKDVASKLVNWRIHYFILYNERNVRKQAKCVEKYLLQISAHIRQLCYWAKSDNYKSCWRVSCDCAPFLQTYEITNTLNISCRARLAQSVEYQTLNVAAACSSDGMG